jgi:hypothetical protein
MSEDWTEAVKKAARDIALAAAHGSVPGTAAEEVGSLLITLGKAAGHADHLASPGSAGRTAREHFRQHMLDVGAAAVLMLRCSYEQQGRPAPAPAELTGELARRRVIPARQPQTEGEPAPAGHAAGALGEAMVALGRAVTLKLYEDNLGALDDAIQRVLAAAIAAMALAARESP